MGGYCSSNCCVRASSVSACLGRVGVGLKPGLDGVYSMKNYYVNMRRMGEGIASSSFMPTWMTLPYAYTLGHLLVVLGILLLLGVKTRFVLILSGLTYLSLAVGLMAVEESGGVAWLAIHVILCAGALLLVSNNRFALTRN